jgi:hypothetical protein
LRGRFYTSHGVSYQQYEENLKVGAPIIAERQPILADADDVAAQDEHSSGCPSAVAESAKR